MLEFRRAHASHEPAIETTAPVVLSQRRANLVDIAPSIACTPFAGPVGYPTMPSLFRFLIFLGILSGLAYGTVFSLANLVKLKPREIGVTVPAKKFFKRR